MGHRHTKDEILAGAVAVATDGGLSQLSFGRVAKHLDIHDRMVVYYFPTKADLVTAVVQEMGGSLQELLADAFTAADDHVDMARRAWPVLATPEADKVFAIFFEANGLATAGREPYASLVTDIVAAWTGWLMEFFSGSAKRRMTEAEATIALVDGLVLLRLLRGPEAAARAAKALGIG